MSNFYHMPVLPKPDTKRVSINVDGKDVEVPEGTNLVEALKTIGIETPHFCYHQDLPVSGNCRQCMVETDGPRGMGLAIACYTPVRAGMKVATDRSSEKVKQARQAVMEFQLANHPLDCPICDQAGECDLQDLTYEHGVSQSRYQFERRTFDPIDIGETIKLHMTRCIYCYRCVKVAEQITDGRVHSIINRGDASEISTYIEQAIDNDFSGNMIDVCPVGALTDRTFRFSSRVWFTKPMDAHRDCAKCSGKVAIWLKGQEVLRVTGRKNQWGEVEEWICNECRFEKKQLGDWVVEGPRNIDRHSVISQGHYTLPVKQKVLDHPSPNVPELARLKPAKKLQ